MFQWVHHIAAATGEEITRSFCGFWLFWMCTHDSFLTILWNYTWKDEQQHQKGRPLLGNGPVNMLPYHQIYIKLHKNSRQKWCSLCSPCQDNRTKE
jgi:hypothetical protein